MLSADELATQYFVLQRVQLQLKAGEKQDKSDDSPVTIADYGKSHHAPPADLSNNKILDSCLQQKFLHKFAGSQALVAYSLQKSLPHSQFSMVAEEDSADLRCEGH